MTNSSILRLLALAGAAALSLAACGSGGTSTEGGEVIAPIAAPTGKTWSQTVAATADGMRIGNPDAPLQIIEFASPTCSHCAEFSQAGFEPLKREFIDTGRVNLEVRPFMLNPIDLVVATALNCAGPDRFFPMLENLYASQQELITGVQSAPEDLGQRAAALPEAQRFPMLAQGMKIDAFFAARGMPAAEFNACLADPARVNRWAESTTRNGQEFEVTGTPTFVINGQVSDANTWETLRERLRAAGAR